jgi:hypothetical protein
VAAVPAAPVYSPVVHARTTASWAECWAVPGVCQAPSPTTIAPPYRGPSVPVVDGAIAIVRVRTNESVVSAWLARHGLARDLPSLAGGFNNSALEHEDENGHDGTPAARWIVSVQEGGRTCVQDAGTVSQ